MFLCLYFSCIKLKQYIKSVDVYVSSNFDIIKHMLSKPILLSRIGKWVLALTGYFLTYVLLKEMKAQVVADFIVDHAIVKAPQNYLEPEPWKLYFDGSNYKNGSDIKILIISSNYISTKFKYKINDSYSNNEAEYDAMVAGLDILLDFEAKIVEVRGDSKLVVKKITKEYGCIKENLIIYFVIVNRLIKCFYYFNIKHVPRLVNQEENELTQIALGYKVAKENLEDLVEVRGRVESTRFSPSNFSMTKLGSADPEIF